MLGWGGGGVGWGGGVNVLSSAYSTCCYAAEISGMLATLHVATLQRSRECLLRYMLLRCRDLLWYPCYVTCCYAAEISGMLATLHVATLQRSPVVSLLITLHCFRPRIDYNIQIYLVLDHLDGITELCLRHSGAYNIF